MKKTLFILAVFVISLILTFFSGCGPKTETKPVDTVRVPDYTEVSDDHLTISDVSWRCTERRCFRYLTVTGNAKNTGTCLLEWVKIYVKGYDSYGNIVVNNYADIGGGGFLGPLSPGQNVNWGVSVEGIGNWTINKVTVGYSYEPEVYIEPSSDEGMLSR